MSSSQKKVFEKPFVNGIAMAEALREGYLQHLQIQKAAAKDVRKVLQEAARESRRIVLSGIGDASLSELERRGRAGSAFRALEAVDEDLWEGVSRSTRTRMRSAGRAADEAFGSMTQALVENYPGELSPEFRQGMIAASRRRVRNVAENFIAERPLSDAVYRNSQWTKAKAREIVRVGLAQGTSARGIAGQVSGFINPSTPGGARYAAFRLARTEINNTFHAASVRGAARTPWVEAMRWQLSSSHGQTDDCDDIAEDSSGRNFGEGEYRVEDVPDKPHPNCLCYTVEITPSDSEFANALGSGRYNSWLSEEGLQTF